MPHPAFDRTAHRPWPVPDSPWRWRQSWCDLLFAHWPVPVDDLRPLVPGPLEIQQFDGTSWVGIVPFHMKGVMRRPLPDLPWISSFSELNVRLYVEYGGKPGVWFLSLDATNPLAVWAARRFFYLPYYHAEITIDKMEAQRLFHYCSKRKEQKGVETPVNFEAVYEPVSDPYEARPGTLEHFLTERYCLYAQDPDGALYRSEVHHRPWPLQKAEADISTNELLEPFDVRLPDTSPLLHFASRMDVVVWPPERLRM